MTDLPQVLWYGVMNGSAYVLFAIGLALGFGVMRVMNFAHGELYMLGGMGIFVFTHYLGLNLLVAAAVSIFLVAMFGIVVNRVAVLPVYRVSILAPMISTLALSLMLLYGFEAIFTTTAKLIRSPLTKVWFVGGVHFSAIGLTVVLTAALVTAGLYLFLQRTRMGKQMRATVQNITGARLVGINTTRVYDYTFFIVAGLAALGGILMALLHTANTAMGQPALILGFVIVIVAGMGNLVGATVVALIVGIIESVLSFYAVAEYTQAFLYLILVIVLLVRPRGLFAARGDRS